MTSRAPTRLIGALVAVATVVQAWAGATFAGATRYERGDGWARLDVTLPGRLVGFALPSVGGGSDGGSDRRDVVLLVVPIEDDARADGGSDDGEAAPAPACPQEEKRTAVPTALYRLDREGEGGLSLLRDDLPHDCTGLVAADLDDDGIDELLIARPDVLLLDRSLAPGGEDREALPSVLEAPDPRWLEFHAVVPPDPGRDGTVVATMVRRGSLVVFGPGGPDGRLERLGEAPLPLEGDLRGDGLVISTRIPHFIGSRPSGALLFATPPESLGKLRLRTRLIEVKGSGEPTVTESWARLPEPEEVLGRRFLMVDGRPVLLVTTKPAGKLNLFGEKRLRLYPLARDRSRLGLNPLFAAKSRMNLWQSGTPSMIDVDGDGVEDLVIGYWKGLLDSRVVLDAYLRAADGSFVASPRTTAFDVKKGDRSFVQYGEDLDGDGLPDLLVRGAEGLLIYRGRSSRNGKKLVEPRPLTIPLGPAPETPESVGVEVDSRKGARWIERFATERPRLADLEGDGRVELLLVDRGGRERPAGVRIVWLR
jgi:hypothetical protein